MERPPYLHLVASLALTLAVGTTQVAAQPRLVANLNREPDPLPADPYPGFGVAREGVLYFPAKDAQHGYELWRTDGTEAGTYRLTDLCPGKCSGIGTIFGFVGGRLLFQGFDGGGPDLWSTDGTLGGEIAVADLCAGSCRPQLRDWEIWQGRLWILTGREGASPMLWVTDGRAGGTLRLGNTCRDLGLCAPSGSLAFFHFVGVAPGDRGLLVSAAQSGGSSCLYRTDGSAAGTVSLRCSPANAVHAKGSAAQPFSFFIAGPELWRTDGTAEGTRLVRDLRDLVGPDFLDVDGLRAFGTHCHLLVGGQWIRSDGTAEGTVKLGQVPFQGQFGTIDSRVYFIADNGVWSAGGTPETAHRVVEFFGGAERILETPARLFILGFASEPFLWTTDGTPAGTHEIALPAGPALEYYHLDVTEFAGGVLFSRGRQELWSVDPGGTLVRPVHVFRGPEAPSWLDHQIVLGDRLLFFAMDRASFDEPAFGPYGTVRLYSSTGTASGTDRLTPNAVAAIDERTFDHPPFDPSFFKLGSRVFFPGAGVSVTDGTAAGTTIASRSSLVDYRAIAALGDRLLFAGTTRQTFCSDETELWVTTGSAATTKRLVDLNPTTNFGGSRCEVDPNSSNPGPGVTLGSRVLFAAEDGVHGRELFVTDGTKAGSKLLLNIQPDRPGGLGSAPSDFVRLGRKVLFVADDGITGRELWASNGTSQGTYRVADLLPGAVGSEPRNLVPSGPWVYFFAKAGRREALYRTDGTARGTTLVSDLTRNGAPAIAGAELVVSGGHLFFPAFSSDTGLELWRSAGTAATTGLVLDLWPGPRSSTPQGLTAARNGVLFAATDGETGLEGWWSNGSRTVSLGDIAPGPDASNPGPFQAVGDQILTGADDGQTGRELWAIPLAAIPRP